MRTYLLPSALLHHQYARDVPLISRRWQNAKQLMIGEPLYHGEAHIQIHERSRLRLASEHLWTRSGMELDETNLL